MKGNDSTLTRLKQIQIRPAPEATLLLSCARLQMLAEDRKTATAAIERGPDWELVLSAAQMHGVTALVHRHLSNGLSGGVPTEVLQRLREDTLAQVQRNLALTSELVFLLRLFAGNDIEVIPLKGPLLAERIYGSVALRKMEDLDLLIKASDVPRAVGLLCDRGYRFPGSPLPYWDKAWFTATAHLRPMVSKTGQIVELHHSLLAPRGRRRHVLEEILVRTRPAAFANIQVHALKDKPFIAPS